MLTILTTLAVTLTSPVSSETAKPGDNIQCDQASCTVVHVQKRRNRARDGSLTIMVQSPDGTRCFATVTGRTGTIGNIAALGAGGLLIKGKHATAQPGDTLTCDA